jgi:hypothetical protein
MNERQKVMKCVDAIVTVGALVWLAGCASAPTVAVLEPVGPAPVGQAKALDQGSLQVYSARQREPTDANDMGWQSDYNFARNLFDYNLAHTDYIILTQDGKTLQYVRNARNPADPMPARVTLPPGRYKVEAQAQEQHGETVNLLIPVAVEPGKITVVHLCGNWKPRGHFANADVVRLPDGQIAGWLAAH